MAHVTMAFSLSFSAPPRGTEALRHFGHVWTLRQKTPNTEGTLSILRSAFNWINAGPVREAHSRTPLLGSSCCLQEMKRSLQHHVVDLVSSLSADQTLAKHSSQLKLLRFTPSSSTSAARTTHPLPLLSGWEWRMSHQKQRFSRFFTPVSPSFHWSCATCLSNVPRSTRESHDQPFPVRLQDRLVSFCQPQLHDTLDRDLR